MVHIFIAYRKANAAIRDKVAGGIEALGAIDGGEAYPVTLWSDAHLLAGDDWERQIAVNIDNADIFLLLVTADANGGYALEEELGRAIGRARLGHCRIVPVVVDNVLGFLTDYELEDYALHRIPKGGIGVSQPPYNLDETAWLADVLGGVRDAVRGILESAQMSAPDIVAARNTYRDAAQRAIDIAQAEGNVLGSEAPVVLRAIERALDVLSVGTPGILAFLAAARERVHYARRRAGRADAEQTVGALKDLTAALDDFVHEARLAGFRDPVEQAAAAPGQLIEAAAPANVEEIRKVQRDFDEAEVAGEGLIVEARIAPPEHKTALAEVGSRLAAESRLARALSESPSVDPVLLTETTDQLAETVRSAQGMSWIVGEAARLIDKAAMAVGRAVRRVLRLVSRVRGQPIPSEPEPSEREPPPRPPWLAPPPASGEWMQTIPGIDEAAWPSMVSLPRGRFMMGSPPLEAGSFDDEKPAHQVTIGRAFAIGRFPVTFREWDAALAAGADLARPADEGWGRGDRPVINVSWKEAQTYIDWLNDRLGLLEVGDRYGLPTEAEWEYACRAGTKTAYSFGDTISRGQARFEARDGTTVVDQFPPNAFGLHDMHGNVWEWCQDVWHESYDDPDRPDDGLSWEEGGDPSRRVLRGGSWDNDPQLLRSAFRIGLNTSDRISDIGFRLARTLSRPAS